ncbi:Ig-like domain-containing protein [Photobacterium sanguinicancri]|uniref:Ig-like domain-containing protein n=1 Tax=Photobacterium sanguinicancri TaxID=875932 RepID=UPI0021C4034D|nr:Ig-like domain-containing protein [Photobacterium sanguinicancri]
MRKLLVLCSLIILGCNSGTSTSVANDIVSVEISYDNISGTSAARIPSHSSLPFSATAHFSNKSKRDVTKDVHWVSSDPTVAAINNTGVAKGITEGTSTIMALYKGIKSNAIELSITEASLWSLNIDFSSDFSGELPKGVSFLLTAMATYNDMSQKEAISDVAWHTSDPSIITVDKHGRVKGINLGTAIITATLNGKVSNTLKVSVRDAVFTKIKIQPKESALHVIPVGFTQSMVAVGTLSDGFELALQDGVVWSVDDDSIATITNHGVVKAHNEGETTVSVQYGSIKSAPLSIVSSKVSLEGIELSSPIHNLPKGNKLQVQAIGTFSDGSKVDVSNDILWSSDDENIAIVSHTGVVLGVEVGQAIISATFDNIKTDFNIDINNALTKFEIVTLGSSTAHSSKTVKSGTILVKDRDITLVYRGDDIEVFVQSEAQYIQASDVGHDFFVRKDEDNNIIGFSGFVRVYRTSKEHMYDDSFYTTFFSASSTRSQASVGSNYSGELFYSVLSEDEKPLTVRLGRVTLNLNEGSPTCVVSGRDVYTCVDAEFNGTGFISKLYDENKRRQGDLFVKFYGDTGEFASGYIFENAYQGNAKKVDVFVLTKQL